MMNRLIAFFSVYVLFSISVNGQSLNQQLFEALDNHQTDLAKQLIEQGADPKALYDGEKYSGSKGWTVFLFGMVTSNDVDFMRYLVSKGADPYSQIPNYDSYNYAIHHAAKSNMTDMVDYLIGELNVSPNLPDGGGMTPLAYACIGQYPNAEFVKHLIDKGANVNYQDATGRAALHWAVGYQYLSLVKILVENGADVSLESSFGSPRSHVKLNALAVAMSYRNVEIFNYLLSKNIDYKYSSKEYSSIYVAAYWGFPYAINKLIALGVDKKRADNFGETPLNIATENGSKLSQQILMYGPSDLDKRLFRLMEDPQLKRVKIGFAYKTEANNQVTDLTGQTVDVKKYFNRNKLIFVNFWATWCPPCVREMPSMQSMKKSMGDDIELIAISVDKKIELVTGFQQNNPSYDFTYLHDPEWKFYSEMGSSLPGSFVLGSDGTILASVSGAFEWDSPKALELLSILKNYR